MDPQTPEREGCGPGREEACRLGGCNESLGQHWHIGMLSDEERKEADRKVQEVLSISVSRICAEYHIFKVFVCLGLFKTGYVGLHTVP